MKIFLGRLITSTSIFDQIIKIQQIQGHMLVNNFSISRISYQSSKHSDNRKNSPSTQPQESPEQYSTNSNEVWDQDQSSMQYRKLCNQIDKMEKYQQEMEKKYRKYIEHMLVEIEKNNDNNARLAAEVNSLRQEVSESRKDILIIDEYIKSNLKRDNPYANEPQNAEKRGPSRDLLGSCSRSKNLLSRRTPAKLFKSKLSIKS